MKRLHLVWLAVLLAATTAHAQSLDLRVTGTYAPAPGDTLESARQLALVDAYRQALSGAVARLGVRPDVASLHLAPARLEAYATALVDVVEEPARTGPAFTGATATPVLASLRARVELPSAVAIIAGLRKDPDATQALIETWSDIQLLQRRLAGLTLLRRDTAAGDVQSIVDEQLRDVKALGVKRLAARAFAAMARTEESAVGGRAVAPGGRARAKELAQAALSLMPDAPDTQYILSDLLIDAQQPGEAETAIRKALATAPDSIPGRIRLAEALRLQGRFVEAVAELRDVLERDPASARAHSDLGMILRAERHFAEATDAYREAIRLDPDSADAHNGLAITLASQGKRDEAADEFREIVRIDPDSTIGHYNLASVLADLDRDVESAAALREVIRINPNHYNARYNLGELFRMEGKYDDSARQFREFLRLVPDTPQNQRNIKRATAMVQRFEEQ
jgi:tetratricopeptide (TPR) repeat protein